MKLNKGMILIESLCAILVCVIIVTLILSVVKLEGVEEKLYEKYEQRIYER